MGRFSEKEAWMAAREENMGSEDQALTVHSKKGRRRSHYCKGKDPHHRDNIIRDL